MLNFSLTVKIIYHYVRVVYILLVGYLKASLVNDIECDANFIYQCCNPEPLATGVVLLMFYLIYLSLYLGQKCHIYLYIALYIFDLKY